MIENLVAPTARGVLVLLVSATALAAQRRVEIVDRGPGQAGRLLQQVLASPYRLVEPDTGWFIQSRGEQARASLVVLGRTAAISGFVDGDVVVVGGDLHVRPGAHLGGRAIAIGGGVYSSARAIVVGETRSFPDETYDITRTSEGFQLSYRSLRTDVSPSVLLPGIYGLRVPTYDRVNGATVPVGPTFRFAGGRGEADLLVSYRSDLGKFDPSLNVDFQMSRRTRTALAVARGTFTNDSWIRSDFVNSLTALVTGQDTRNYYRADRAELTLHHLLETSAFQVEPLVGARFEDAWTVGPAVGEARGPWSILGRTDDELMWRPNPLIRDGRITSVLAGTAIQWQARDVDLRALVSGERNLDAPNDVQFTQLTSDLGVSFPTFGLQEYRLEVHHVTTFGDTPPPQRFAYVGGPGTLDFLDLLEQGGDELLLVEQYYSAPIPRIKLGFLGIPSLFLRHRIGSAGIGGLPDFEQLLGLGVTVTLLRVEVQVDPADGKVRIGGGLSFSR